MSCGCKPGNDKCVQDECRNCCYCGKLLTDSSFYNGIKHVDPPLLPRCGEEGGFHEPLVFPAPEDSKPERYFIASMPPPVSAAIVNNVLAVRLCKLCGVVYWEPLEKDDSG